MNTMTTMQPVDAGELATIEGGFTFNISVGGKTILAGQIGGTKTVINIGVL